LTLRGANRLVRGVATEAVPAALATSAVGVPEQSAPLFNPNVCVVIPNESPVTTKVERVVSIISERSGRSSVPSWKLTTDVAVEEEVTVADPMIAKRGAAPVKVANPAATLATLPVVAGVIVDETPETKVIISAPLAADLVASGVPLVCAAVAVSKIFRVIPMPEEVSSAAYRADAMVTSIVAPIACVAVNWKTTDDAPTVPPVIIVPGIPGLAEIVAVGAAPNTPFVRS
jgi:hypothetical protein